DSDVLRGGRSGDVTDAPGLVRPDRAGARLREGDGGAVDVTDLRGGRGERHRLPGAAAGGLDLVRVGRVSGLGRGRGEGDLLRGLRLHRQGRGVLGACVVRVRRDVGGGHVVRADGTVDVGADGAAVGVDRDGGADV